MMTVCVCHTTHIHTYTVLQVFVAITFLLEKMVAAVYSSDHAGSPKSSLPLPNKGALVEEEEEEEDDGVDVWDVF